MSYVLISKNNRVPGNNGTVSCDTYCEGRWGQAALNANNNNKDIFIKRTPNTINSIDLKRDPSGTCYCDVSKYNKPQISAAQLLAFQTGIAKLPTINGSSRDLLISFSN